MTTFESEDAYLKHCAEQFGRKAFGACNPRVPAQDHQFMKWLSERTPGDKTKVRFVNAWLRGWDERAERFVQPADAIKIIREDPEE